MTLNEIKVRLMLVGIGFELVYPNYMPNNCAAYAYCSQVSFLHRVNLTPEIHDTLSDGRPIPKDWAEDIIRTVLAAYVVKQSVN